MLILQEKFPQNRNVNYINFWCQSVRIVQSYRLISSGSSSSWRKETCWFIVVRFWRFLDLKCSSTEAFHVYCLPCWNVPCQYVIDIFQSLQTAPPSKQYRHENKPTNLSIQIYSFSLFTRVFLFRQVLLDYYSWHDGLPTHGTKKYLAIDVDIWKNKRVAMIWISNL